MNRIIHTSRGYFNIREYGNPESPPLMLVHGWPQTSYCWHHMAPFLPDHYIIAPDIRGMGDSNRELNVQHYEKNEMAADLFAIADELGMDSFSLGGHDWGGAIVQEMALLHPKRIRKLIILNMVIIHNAEGQAAAGQILVKQLFRSSWYQFFMSIREFPEALLAGKEDIWIRFFSRGMSKPIPEDAIQEYIRCYKVPNTITTASNIYRTVGKDRKRWKSYEGRVIEIPTRIIHGILDPVIIKEYLVGVEKCFTEVSIDHLHAGHFVVDELPEEVGKRIHSFISQ